MKTQTVKEDVLNYAREHDLVVFKKEDLDNQVTQLLNKRARELEDQWINTDPEPYL